VEKFLTAGTFTITHFNQAIMHLLKKIMIVVLVIVPILTLGIFAFLQKTVFGKHPSGARLQRIEKSSNYRDGQFQNLSETPMMTGDVSYWDMARKYFGSDDIQKEPPAPFPSVKTDLNELIATSEPNKPVIVWFGHSTYLIRIGGKTILVDPVLSARASPVQFVGSASYNGTRIITAADLPPLDAVIITHDHYDHLDYETILQLVPTTKHFHTSLGVGEHLEHWGVPAKAISEYDWWEHGTIADGIEIIAAPARHFSGRGVISNKTLWSSFIIKTATHSLYVGGDSGYDTHFKLIGEKFGPFDLALLECGQYNVSWKLIHMMPEETVQAAQDLRAKVLQPVHWGKFTLALHAWDESIRRVTTEATKQGVRLTTPRVGEVIRIDSVYPSEHWWEAVK
jgi:L-ascorbate metabolism protein UlaG (beta-lactamase superfamily)